MNQHDEEAEVDLIKGIRAAEKAGDHQTRNRLFDALCRRYEDDAEQLAASFERDEEQRGNLKGHLLARIESSIRHYDYETFDSFHVYVMGGWKRYAIREYFRQHRVTTTLIPRVRRAEIANLDAPFSADEDAGRLGDMVPDEKEDQDVPDGRDLVEWLSRRFDVSEANALAALRDTISGDAGPVERRIGLSVLSRRMEHRSSVSRFCVTCSWMDAATRRSLCRKLAEPRVDAD